ncbi:MAG: hypothetical protein M3406_02900 [Chloroflexota bacterium]|nr:hypothetical protein [Chloroflexota bacterium]
MIEADHLWLRPDAQSFCHAMIVPSIPVNEIRAVCFDLDDTLRDPSGARDALLRTCRRVSAITGIDPAMLLAANSEAWPRLWREVEVPWTLGGTSGEIVTIEAWRRTLEACDHHDPESAAQAAEIHLEEIVRAQRLFDDARTLLNAIGPDIRIELITNGASDTQRAAMHSLGIKGDRQPVDQVHEGTPRLTRSETSR